MGAKGRQEIEAGNNEKKKKKNDGMKDRKKKKKKNRRHFSHNILYSKDQSELLISYHQQINVKNHSKAKATETIFRQARGWMECKRERKNF